jgi:hypothetical protein
MVGYNYECVCTRDSDNVMVCWRYSSIIGGVRGIRPGEDLVVMCCGGVPWEVASCRDMVPVWNTDGGHSPCKA